MGAPITIKKRKVTVKAKSPQEASAEASEQPTVVAPNESDSSTEDDEADAPVFVSKPQPTAKGSGGTSSTATTVAAIFALTALLVFLFVLLLQWTELTELLRLFPRTVQIGMIAASAPW